jgi:hypothetical protein
MIFLYINIFTIYIYIKMVDKQISKYELFESAYNNNNINDMHKYYEPSLKDNYFIDVALEEGKIDKVNFFLNKDVKPSLYANQMARINGHNILANQIDSLTDFRNKVNVKNVYWNYDRSNKTMYWSNPSIPNEFKY